MRVEPVLLGGRLRLLPIEHGLPVRVDEPSSSGILPFPR
jgi:hypothetical protein